MGPPPDASSADIRVVSYNILADAYSHTWGGLYPYLSRAAASADYRMQLALADVRGLSADIVCLQEVDTKWFERFWQPAMEHAGYVVRPFFAVSC
jgi:2',5'-phosphodiesterase